MQNRQSEKIQLKPHCKMRFEPAVDAINERLKQQKADKSPLLVAIDGRCGSGKTTLGLYLQELFDCNLFHMDDFFLRVEQRTPERMKEVGGNVDYERFEKTVLEPLQKKQNVFYQPFSCREWKLMQTSEIPYRQLNIIEGSYSLHPYFKDPYDLHIFMDIDPDSQMENIVKRNGIEKAKDFEEKWIPKEEAYFEKFRVQEGAVRILW